VFDRPIDDQPMSMESTASTAAAIKHCYEYKHKEQVWFTDDQ